MACIYFVYSAICLDVRKHAAENHFVPVHPVVSTNGIRLDPDRAFHSCPRRLFKFIMTGHGSHTLHFVLNERCLVRPTWLESRWIQWDQRAAELGCSFQRPAGSPPIPPPPATPCHFLTSNVGGLLLGKTRRKHRVH